MSGNQAIWLFTGAATLFLVGTDVFIMSPLLPAISAEFGVTPAAAGWLVTVMAVMYACGSPWPGHYLTGFRKGAAMYWWQD
ncbi:hypothetical protein [Brevibacillus borstelensis]